jgi:DNA-binding transcriptional regulator GbsR (MarR family)
MSEDPDKQTLLQLKIDYLAFMEQVHGALGFEPNLIAVLFSLLLEGDYITQDRIIELTGLARSTVSETLKKLTDPFSSFPVLATRRPGDRRKFYYCPLGINDYVMTFFTSATAASDFSEEILHEMLARLDALGSETPEALHVRRFFTYLLDVLILIQDLLENTRVHMERFTKDPSYIPKFTEEEFAAVKREHMEPPVRRFRLREDDSLLDIKREYIRETLEHASPVGRRREIAAVSLALILSADLMTQEEIMEVTGYSRSTVSENLAKIEELNVLSVVKKPGDRKKYYRSMLKLEGYGTQKFQIQRSGYGQIGRMIEGRFLPELRKIPGSSPGKERLAQFLKENVRAYRLILEYISFLHDFMLKRTETFEISRAR